MERDKREVCTIRIMFPVDTDQQAIEYKKKIGEVLSSKPDAMIEFKLTNLSIPINPRNDTRG